MAFHTDSGASHSSDGVRKALTGIEGLDEVTRGGFPRGRITLVAGEAGAGKTVLALETLANGFRKYGEPGILVAFEESPSHVLANAADFTWAPGDLNSDQLYLLDARLSPDVIQTGDFDLGGLLAGLSAKAKAMGAKRVVFDSLDTLLLLLDPRTELREIYRLRDWLDTEDLTCLVTAKLNVADPALQRLHGRLQFISDCVIELDHRLSEEVSLRSLRVVKYRGSSFAENAHSIVIGPRGIELGGMWRGLLDYAVSTERVSSGVDRLDSMLDGGYYRGTSILITGSPGTSKSTLGGAFVEAACTRGERALLITFDEVPSEMIRNLSSVGIELQKHVDAGTLTIRAMRTETKSAEEHLLAITGLLKECAPRCIVIDPISAMLKAGGESTALAVAQRLLLLTRSQGITLLATSQLDSADPSGEATRLQISTVADSWLHVSYVINGGERNRALTIIKSRGTRHSNQVRELLLSDQGVTLADVYTSGGEVLMGTLRWEKEKEVERQKEAARSALDIKGKKQELAEVELQARLSLLTRELEVGRAELLALAQEQKSMERVWGADLESMLHLRSADTESEGGEPVI